MRRLNIALFAAMLMLSLVAPPASAQEATPTTGRDLPAPEECTVEPRSEEELRALTSPDASPVAVSPLELSQVPFGAVDGDAADPETTAAFSDLVRESWACLNANDWARFFALLTDEEVRQNFPPEDIVALGTMPVGAPFPPENQTALFAILDVEVLPDGRVGGFAIVDTPGDPLPVEINYQIAVETDEGWRLDDFVCFGETGELC